MTNLFDLTGRTALVTGCRRGIGRAMAVALAQAGADIEGVSATLQPDSDVERAVRAAGRRFNSHRCDFTDRDALYRFIAGLPSIDILVNNAGMILRKPAAEHPDDYWDRILEANVTSAFILSREVGRAMVARGSGKIIFLASLLSFQGGINVPSYAASKGAVAQLVKAFANEWAAAGVNVNGIAPGYIETDNTEALRNDPGRAAAILSRIPANRWGKPDDFAGPVVFLASAASDYVHGAILSVDGGWMGR